MDSNKLINKIKENKVVITLFIILISIYSSAYVNNLPSNILDIVDTPVMKFIIFVTISYLAMDNPTIGIILTMLVLVTLQVASNMKIKRDIYTDLQIEHFTNMDFNLESESKQEQNLDYLDYLKKKNIIKALSINKLINEYIKYPDIILSYEKFKINYSKLQLNNLTQEQYYINLIDFYQSKLELLEKIFKYKKDTMDENKVLQIENLINETKNKDKNDKKSWFEKLDVILEFIK